MNETNHNGGVPFAFGACHYKNAIPNSTLKTPPSPTKQVKRESFLALNNPIQPLATIIQSKTEKFTVEIRKHLEEVVSNTIATRVMVEAALCVCVSVLSDQ